MAEPIVQLIESPILRVNRFCEVPTLEVNHGANDSAIPVGQHFDTIVDSCPAGQVIPKHLVEQGGFL
jgi:hypothetical protein